MKLLITSLLSIFLTSSGLDSIIVWKLNSTDLVRIQLRDNLIRANVTKPNIAYKQHVAKLRDYTVDEKCHQGMDIGVGFQVYTPYVDMGSETANSTFLSGIVPHIILDMTRYCCPKSKISYASHFGSTKQMEQQFDTNSSMDLSFPVYGLDGPKTNHFKDMPFVPVVTAPKMVLLVPERLFDEKNSRTQVLMNTIFNAWPMLVFMIVSAMLSGLFVWLLDHHANATEFPSAFFHGAWEGIWWAFVTMTTVGYGDRSPKSVLARAFCIMWILFGIIVISLFTGLVTAALSASSTPVFNIPGAKIGAVSGSLEYRVGVGLNADMVAYPNHPTMLGELIDNRSMQAMIIDNYILSAIREDLGKYRLRIEREIDYPVTYGVVLKDGAHSVAKCFHKYTRHHGQEMFEVIASNLKPVKNPTDDVSLEVQAAQKLFYEEWVFKFIIYLQAALLGAFLIIGVGWEFYRRRRLETTANIRASYIVSEYSNSVGEKLANGNHKNSTIDDLIRDYEVFHQRWVAKVLSLRDKYSGEGEQFL